MLGIRHFPGSLKLFILIRKSRKLFLGIPKVRLIPICCRHTNIRTVAACKNVRNHLSNRLSIIDGCFEWLFSLALGLDPIPLRTILNSVYHRHVLSSFLPARRRQLKDMIQLEYDYMERTLNQARYDITALQREYDIASHLMEPVTPIQRLTVELLELVFSFVPERYFYSLMRTCRRWKEIALSMWTPPKLTPKWESPPKRESPPKWKPPPKWKSPLKWKSPPKWESPKLRTPSQLSFWGSEAIFNGCYNASIVSSPL